MAKQKNKGRKKSRAPKKTKRRLEESGIVHLKSGFNNTTITVTDIKGNVLAWSTPGKVGFTGTRKSTAYAAQLAAKEVADRVYDMGLRRVEVKFRGSGPGREAAIRALFSTNLEVKKIRDMTPVPHGGCRPKKRRRV
ncbi:MAG: 30S ribosomal protein S11 [Candidatus Zixiibacteriota bacterium]